MADLEKPNWNRLGVPLDKELAEADVVSGVGSAFVWTSFEFELTNGFDSI